MVSDTKGKAPYVTSNNFHRPSTSSRHNSRSNHQPSGRLNARDQSLNSVDEDPHFSPTQSPTGQRRSSNRSSRSYNIPLRAERFSRDNSPVPLPQHQLSFREKGPVPLRPSLRSIPEDLSFQSQQERASAPNFSFDNEGPVVPDIYPQYNYGDPYQQDPMDYSARYQNGSHAPAAHTYAQPSFTQGARPADDPEKVRLRAELAAYQAMEGKIKASEKQREREEQIRKETEAEFQRRMEHIQKSQEEARRDIEKVKKEAEEATWKRAQAAQRENEAKEAEKEREAKIMESEIRIKIEMERKAEEAEKRAREKLEHEMELRLHEKMKGKMDDFMELAKQRFLAIEGPSVHQRATEWRGNRDELDYGENQDQQVKQQEPPPSLPHSPRESLTDSSCGSSQFHKTENSTSVAARSHSGRRPPSVPVAPSQSFFYGEPHYQEGSLCSDQGPPFHPHAAPPPRHRTGYMPPGHNPWHPSVHDYARGYIPKPPNLAEELSLAFAEVLRNWNLNDRMAGSMMDERTPFDYPPFEGHTAENPRKFYYPEDRASVFERHREWPERDRRQDWAQHFDETGQSPDPGAQTFPRPFQSRNMAPQPQQSSNDSVVDGDIDSDSDQASTYATPPESQAGDVMIGEDTTGGHTIAAIAPAVERPTVEAFSRRLVALDGDGSRTCVVSSLEDSFRERKVAGQLYTAAAHMNRQEKPMENGFVPELKHLPMERDISRYLLTDNMEAESLD